MLEWEGEKYCTAKEAAILLQVSRGTFYQNLKGIVKAHELPARKRLHYKLADIEKHRQVKEIAEKAS